MLRQVSCVVVALSLASSFATGQSAPKPGNTYAFKISAPVASCDFDGGNKASTFNYAPVGARFFYVRTSTDATDVVIQFLLWNESNDNFSVFNAAKDQRASTPKNFCVEKTVFEQMSDEIFSAGPRSWQLASGILILPVKFRPGKDSRAFDFSKDVTFGTTAGLRFRLSARREVFLNMLGGVGLSSVTLNSSNTISKLATSTDRAAFTWTSGLMLEVEKFQFGAFLGQDRISQPNERDWVYQGKNWWAIGLGYSIFGSGSGQPAKVNQQ